jgi:hypothetical protein
MPQCRLWAVKVLGDNGTGSLSNIIKGTLGDGECQDD